MLPCIEHPMKEVGDGDLPTGHNSVGDRIVCNEGWDETAELLISDDVKENEVEKSGISGGERKKSWV